MATFRTSGIGGHADVERPFFAVRFSLGLQLSPVRVAGRLSQLIVEIANVCPFVPYVAGMGSFTRPESWRLYEPRRPATGTQWDLSPLTKGTIAVFDRGSRLCLVTAD
jgi:hypothetical protein